MTYRVGDLVTLRTSGHGGRRYRDGVIVAVVPPYERPRTEIAPNATGISDYQTRRTASYVVVDATDPGRRWWPHPNSIEPRRRK